MSTPLFGRNCILMGLGPEFWAREYHSSPPPLEPTRHFHIAYNVVTHVQTKAFACSQGGQYHIKPFLMAIHFNQKVTV